MDPFFGEIRIFASNAIPDGWLPCDGRLLPIDKNQALFSLIGFTYGGDQKAAFALPDLRGGVPVQFGDFVIDKRYVDGVKLGEVTKSTGAEVPTVAVTYAIAIGGLYPTRDR